MNLSTTLDILIAFVIVLLSLSLVVQSVQGALKKALKLKSRQLEQSLVDLFHIAVGSGNPAEARMPFFQMMSGPKGLPAPESGTEVRVLYDAVMKGFQEIGRVAASGKAMMDSISKSDLLKILERISPDSITSDGGKALLRACHDVMSVRTILDECRSLTKDSVIAARIAALREKLTPLLSDVQRIFNGEALGPKVVVADLVNLRGFKAAEVLDLAGELQTKVKEDLNAAKGTADEESLRKLSEAVERLNESLSAAGQSAETAVGLLRARLKHIEDWFDTVMHGFEERYNRGMRTWGIIISILVALTLNANLFRIYRNIASSPAKREVILHSKESGLLGQSTRPGALYPGCKPADPNSPNASLEEAVCDIEQSSTLYGSYGFGWPPKAEVERMFQEQPWPLWLLGCLATGLLLSVGAPFWEDVLESLFGVKNLLRKSGEIRLTESGPGQGLAKTT